ncbi:hypothetical protein PanWU01x14_030760 [Parasponia andersonii]|uniref:Uncharacterized protein n=1 Tax=Parasponia andersonii TaxID=3476 RepID=A0A2P5DUW6_PARAD|nr:hypothetical protein PanWU01x14_030760 [Parasponia andersonii]
MIVIGLTQFDIDNGGGFSQSNSCDDRFNILYNEITDNESKKDEVTGEKGNKAKLQMTRVKR